MGCCFTTADSVAGSACEFPTSRKTEATAGASPSVLRRKLAVLRSNFHHQNAIPSGSKPRELGAASNPSCNVF
jgi:hypothetical protein